MQKEGAGFAGFAAWLDMTPADADMFAIPDPDSLIQLPWNKEVGWLASDLWMNAKPVEASPRVMLKKQIKELLPVLCDELQEAPKNLTENEIISILGPSGCGKTTLLNSISGIDDDFAGKITTNTSSVRRIDNFSYSQQKDLLIPWKNVLDNAVFGLEISGTKKDESYPRALSLMSDFKLELSLIHI